MGRNFRGWSRGQGGGMGVPKKEGNRRMLVAWELCTAYSDGYLNLHGNKAVRTLHTLKHNEEQ